MIKGLHKLFITGVNDILEDFWPLGESSSEVSNLIQKPINFAEVKKLSDYKKEILAKGNSRGDQKPN